ncbi:MAG: dephospho-CoA kinase [Fimbriimonadaceae bacterium]|nr:dephospho-CoA kinase [Fimbriimonadaceae bacterium]
MTPLAITGGVAEGKSTVLRHLASLGARVWSADEEAGRLIVLPQIRERVAGALGLAVQFSRDDLRQLVLTSHDARRALNAVMHRPILRAMADAAPDVCEIPLLIETCLHGRFDEVWVVTCGLPEQRRRLLDRVKDETVANAILDSQLPTRVKCSFAHAIMRTDQPLDHVHDVIQDAWRARLKRLAEGGETDFTQPR